MQTSSDGETNRFWWGYFSFNNHRFFANSTIFIKLICDNVWILSSWLICIFFLDVKLSLWPEGSINEGFLLLFSSTLSAIIANKWFVTSDKKSIKCRLFSAVDDARRRGVQVLSVLHRVCAWQFGVLQRREVCSCNFVVVGSHFKKVVYISWALLKYLFCIYDFTNLVKVGKSVASVPTVVLLLRVNVSLLLSKIGKYMHVDLFLYTIESHSSLKMVRKMTIRMKPFW